jgi:hypothetical protein
MSFLESPKSRFTAFVPTLNSTQLAKPGCVQCGSVLEITDQKKSFSGKCISCEYWISDEDEEEEAFDGEY